MLHGARATSARSEVARTRRRCCVIVLTVHSSSLRCTRTAPAVLARAAMRRHYVHARAQQVQGSCRRSTSTMARTAHRLLPNHALTTNASAASVRCALLRLVATGITSDTPSMRAAHRLARVLFAVALSARHACSIRSGLLRGWCARQRARCVADAALAHAGHAPVPRLRDVR